MRLALSLPVLLLSLLFNADFNQAYAGGDDVYRVGKGAINPEAKSVDISGIRYTVVSKKKIPWLAMKTPTLVGGCSRVLCAVGMTYILADKALMMCWPVGRVAGWLGAIVFGRYNELL